MGNQGIFRKFGTVAVVFFLVWGIFRYFFPIVAPFLVGWFFASLAEPMTRTICRRTNLNRIFAAGVGVTMVLMLLFGALWLLGAVCYRELTALAAGIPDYAERVSTGLTAFRDWAVGLTGRVPGNMGILLGKTVSGLFAEGSMLVDRAASGMLSAAGDVAGKLPGGALAAGTAVISAYMISAQYPVIQRWILSSGAIRNKWIPVMEKLGRTVGLWLKAQIKLTGVTFGIVTAGFLLLRVEHWLLWAAVTAVVDAVPLLGTGTVLIPMVLFSLLWGEQVRAVGLLGLYVTAMLTRSALEPRLVGRQLGMNPLLTLMALYAGFRIWGVAGMIFAPILAVTAMQFVTGE